MFRNLVRLREGLANLVKPIAKISGQDGGHMSQITRQFCNEVSSEIFDNMRSASSLSNKSNQTAITPSRYILFNSTLNRPKFGLWTLGNIPVRQFHAANSRKKYEDYRHRFRTNHLRLHILIIKRQKMKKHKRTKFRKKFKSLLQKMRLKREIAKEKAFRVELLTLIRRAEMFDPREYALKKIAEINDAPKPISKQERYEQLKELMRKNRFETSYIKPPHKYPTV